MNSFSNKPQNNDNQDTLGQHYFNKLQDSKFDDLDSVHEALLFGNDQLIDQWRENYTQVSSQPQRKTL